MGKKETKLSFTNHLQLLGLYALKTHTPGKMYGVGLGVGNQYAELMDGYDPVDGLRRPCNDVGAIADENCFVRLFIVCFCFRFCF